MTGLNLKESIRKNCKDIFSFLPKKNCLFFLIVFTQNYDRQTNFTTVCPKKRNELLQCSKRISSALKLIFGSPRFSEDLDFSGMKNSYSYEKILVKEKLQALITRQKPRDFFDLYFILRKQELRQALKIEKKQKETIILNLKKQNKRGIARELKKLLPSSFWSLVKDLPTALERELENT